MLSDELRHKSAEIWEQNAAFWDQHVGPDGNRFHRQLVSPSARQLLALTAGETVLDVGCGNGQFSRELARLGARVVAFDVSPTFVERARRHAADAGLDIACHLIDALDEDAVRALGRDRFDAAVSNMVLMDVPEIRPIFHSLLQVVKPGGRFVFSITHPCFNQSGMRMVVEQDDRDGDLTTVYSVKINRYASGGADLGIGIRGQPQPQYYFNRTLADYVSGATEAGWVIDGLLEPTFEPLEPDETARHALSWTHFTEIPPVLTVRLRKPATH